MNLMRKIITGAIIVAAGLAQVFVLQHDYWIHVNDYYAIFNHRLEFNENDAVIQFHKPTGADFPLIKGVNSFATAGDKVVGTTKRGYYIADAAGKMVEYSTPNAWHADCEKQAINDATARLVKVSRWDDPALRSIQIGIIAVVGTLLFFSCLQLSDATEEQGFISPGTLRLT